MRRQIILILILVFSIWSLGAEVYQDSSPGGYINNGYLNAYKLAYGNFTITRLPGERVAQRVRSNRDYDYRAWDSQDYSSFTYGVRVSGIPSGISFDVTQVKKVAGGSLVTESINWNGPDTAIEIKRNHHDYNWSQPYNESRNLIIDPSVPDGEYTIRLLTYLTLSDSSEITGGLNIKIKVRTVPTISVEDIDFGQVIFDLGLPPETRTSDINIRGGYPNSNVYIDFPSSVDLKRLGGGEVIPVGIDLPSLTSHIINLDSNGNATTTLNATVDRNKRVRPGTYTGSVEIGVYYN